MDDSNRIISHYPIFVTRDQDTFVLDCPWCGKKHIHGAKEGWRSSHCENPKAPKEYYIVERT